MGTPCLRALRAPSQQRDPPSSSGAGASPWMSQRPQQRGTPRSLMQGTTPACSIPGVPMLCIRGVSPLGSGHVASSVPRGLLPRHPRGSRHPQVSRCSVSCSISRSRGCGISRVCSIPRARCFVMPLACDIPRSFRSVLLAACSSPGLLNSLSCYSSILRACSIIPGARTPLAHSSPLLGHPWGLQHPQLTTSLILVICCPLGLQRPQPLTTSGSWGLKHPRCLQHSPGPCAQLSPSALLSQCLQHPGVPVLRYPWCFLMLELAASRDPGAPLSLEVAYPRACSSPGPCALLS